MNATSKIDPKAAEISEPSVGQFIPVKDITNPLPKRSMLVLTLEAFFVRHRDKLPLVHGVMFIFFVGLLFGPLFLPEPTENATPLTDLSSLANYLIWGLWFPLVFLSVIFSGRSWCGLLCPMGAASEWANKRGLQRAIPAWVRWEGTPIISFLIITILGQTVGVRDHREAIALVFGGTLLAAILLGFFYGRNKRAWCRHMCPIGLLLGVFSRIGAVQFTPKLRRSGGDTYTEKGICPTMIDIKRKEESRHCIECFRCVHPTAKGGLRLDLRTPGKEIEEIHKHNPNLAEIWFFFLGTGAALGGFLWLVLPQFQTWRQAIGAWFIDHEMYWIGESGPWWLMSVHPERREVFVWLDFFTIVGFMLLCTIILGAILSLSTAFSAYLSGKLGAQRNFMNRFKELGYQYAPIAMVSLVMGLGAELFAPLTHLGLSNNDIGLIKLSIFAISLAWSLYLGERILMNQGLAIRYRWIPLIPGLIGSLFVALFWWPALFGM